MKKKLVYGAVVAFLVIPVIAGASTLWSGNRYTIERGETRMGNTYVLSGDTLVAGDIKGDLVSAGGKTIVSGNVSEDALIAGGQVQVSGSVAGDLRVGTGELLVSGSIGGDLAAGAGKIYVAPGSVVGGDIFAGGGDMEIEGAIAGRVRVSGGNVVINGPISGDVAVEGGRLVIGDRAVIGGNVSFRGPVAPIIAPSAVINGTTEYDRDDFGSRRFGFLARGAGVFGAVMLLLMTLLVAILLFALFKRQTQALTHAALEKFWPSAGRGLVAVILLPVCSIIALATVVGVPVGIFGLFTFGAVAILANALSGIIFGVWVARVLLKKAGHQPTMTTVIWGSILLRVIALIPVIGWLVAALFCCLAFGVLAQSAYRHFWLNR